MAEARAVGTAAAAPAAVAGQVERLRHLLRELDGAIVAYSGGVDSTFVLRVAHEELGDRVVGLTTSSASMPAHELEEARAMAREMGVRHLVVSTDEVAIDEYARNPANRCYFCKSNLYDICREHGAAAGIATILDGVNLDDLGDFRPGLAAASERGVRHLLVEAAMTKADVRAASAALHLPTADKPAQPCLASRFPYGTAITHERLHRVERAERALRALGFREFRVRYEGDVARLEIARGEMAHCFDEETRERIVAGIRAAGFERVVLDLEGFRSGSLNERLRGSSRPA